MIHSTLAELVDAVLDAPDGQIRGIVAGRFLLAVADWRVIEAWANGADLLGEGSIVTRADGRSAVVHTRGRLA